MLADALRLVLTNMPLIFFVAAFLLAAFRRGGETYAAALLAFLLLLSVGVENLWFGFLHMAFPDISAASIGWDPSPFEFEIGAADFALGVIATLSFWRSLDFKAAVVIFVTLFYAGVIFVHLREALFESNFAPNNFGVLLVLTIAKLVLLPLLYALTRRASAERRGQ
jgi:hypothetical protein